MTPALKNLYSVLDDLMLDLEDCKARRPSEAIKERWSDGEHIDFDRIEKEMAATVDAITDLEVFTNHKKEC